MNKFLKILTIAGIASSLSFGAYKLTDLNLNNKNSYYEIAQENSVDNIENQPRTLEEYENNIVSDLNNESTDTTKELVNEENVKDETNNETIGELEIQTNKETENELVSETNETTNEQVVDENNSNLEENSSNEELIEETNDVKDNNENSENTEEIENTVDNNEIDNSGDVEDDTTSYITEEQFNQILNNYNQIADDLNNLLENSKNLLESSNLDEFSLTKEQINTINHKTEEFNNLIINIKENIKDINCNLTGDCNNFDNSFKQHYFNQINMLNSKINMLQSAMASYNPYLQFYSNPYSNIYGYSYYYTPNIEDEESKEETTEVTDNNNEEKPSTFNLPNNLDTYGPSKRNIDTFFNTALLDENGMYNNGFMMPYGYNMPFNNFNYGMNYGYNNSNFLSKNAVENNQNENLTSNPAPEEIGKQKRRFAKNIDTYNTKPTSTNINSMTGMKITDIIKLKWNSWFKKDKNNIQDIDKTEIIEPQVTSSSTEPRIIEKVKQENLR